MLIRLYIFVQLKSFKIISKSVFSIDINLRRRDYNITLIFFTLKFLPWYFQ